MPDQTATTGNLENAQNIVLKQCRYTAEHNAPVVALFEQFRLGKGNKTVTIPKVGSMTAVALQDGVDLISSEDIGLQTTDLTTGEAGLKVVLTYKLINQFNEDVFNLVGKQMGDAIARYKDEAGIALFSALNGGTTLGADNKNLSLQNAANCVVYMTAQKAPPPIVIVHHPNTIGYLTTNAAGIGTTYFEGLLQGLPTEILRNFWRININGANVFHDGNIAKIAGQDSGYGAVFSRSAMAHIEGWAPMVEREKDISLRGWEVVLTADYGVFEIDDSYGAPMQYEIGTLATNN